MRMLIFALCVMLWAAAAQGQAAPRIFYSDLESGPNSGGQENQGAFVTIYGRGFGKTRGAATVSVGGGVAENYPLWSDSRIAFQLGHAAKSGAIIVTLPDSSPSNGVPFTVRAGKIHFVATTGNDSGGGSFLSPWRTITKAKDSIHPGDIVYVMDGLRQTGVDDYNASLAIASAGSEGRPKALVAYPNAKVIIGSPSGPEFGIRTPSISGGPFSYWTIAGFTLLGGNQALDLRSLSHWRIIGNELSCPNGDGPAACFEASNSTQLKVLGNSVHDSGKAGGSKLYHSLYFTTDSNYVEVGWNLIANNRSCRGIQFHSSPDGANSGFNQHDLIVHDNVIHGQVCDGINFATIDPSKGPIQAYNNLIYSVGLGPDPADGGSNYACISSPGITNSGLPGSGTAEWFNNTLYDCGRQGSMDSGAFNAGEGSPGIHLRNNIVYAKPGEHYIEPAGKAALISGSNNLWFGAGRAPAGLGRNADPKFVNVSGFDFHLQPESPAVGAGINTGIEFDLDGISRGKNSNYDVGALHASGAAVRARQ